jgi:hypothetical protein
MSSAHCRGQAALETVFLVLFVISGLVYLGFYVQRGMQGNFFGSAQSIGLQFDPRESYTVTEKLERPGGAAGMTDTDHFVSRSGMIEAETLETGELADFCAFCAVPHPDWALTSLPVGPVPREPAFGENTMDSDWRVVKDETFNDLR